MVSPLFYFFIKFEFSTSLRMNHFSLFGNSHQRKFQRESRSCYGFSRVQSFWHFQKFHSNLSRSKVIVHLNRCINFNQFKTTINSWMCSRSMKSIKEGFEYFSLVLFLGSDWSNHIIGRKVSKPNFSQRGFIWSSQRSVRSCLIKFY